MEALSDVLPIERWLLWDRDHARADRLATTVQGVAVQDLKSAAHSADVIACCSTASDAYLEADMIRRGTFIAAVGADSPDKNEIAPGLMAAAKVVTDITAQCVDMGDLHHAIEAGAMTKDDVHAELEQVLTGEKAGRTSPDEIIIYDSTGTGLQDVAAAAAIYERCSDDSSFQSVALAAV